MNATTADTLPAAPASSHELRRLPIGLMLIVSLAAAALAWPLLERFAEAFPNPGLDTEMTNRIRADQNDPIAWAKDRELRWTSLWKNSSLNLGIFAALLGAALGGVSAWSSRYLGRSVVQGVALGLLLGALAGVLGGLASAAVAMRYEPPHPMDPGTKSILIHVVGWTTIGALCGAVVAVASIRKRYPLFVICGIVGGALAAVIYEPAAAILFQLDRSDVPVPEGSLNLLFFLSSAALLIAGSAAAGMPRQARPATSATSTTA